MATKIKTAQIDATARLASKFISSTRDLAAASGDVSYTGVGFTPTSIVAFSFVDSDFKFSFGFSDSAKGPAATFPKSAGSMGGQGMLIGVSNLVDTAQTAIVKSYDADGFTLTWTKAGSPTGTLNMYFMCFR